ncbi:hypothetical protein [Actinomadura rugatobispora]|uniref:Uncharacterized protein n=1 Tax=Actinomadura rugatobispora TaxID=1994 RepID=A0ABW0ZTZ6_9ACTN|nr:hypothetical protein GCM10010200_036810 [Actinomadura rugatobispora]
MSGTISAKIWDRTLEFFEPYPETLPGFYNAKDADTGERVAILSLLPDDCWHCVRTDLGEDERKPVVFDEVVGGVAGAARLLFGQEEE